MMKHLTLLVPLAFCALVACQRAEITNPNYNHETNEVLADFVFNISTGNDQETKQNSGSTQATSTDAFRGINNAYLLYYQLPSDGSILAADADATKIDNLSEVASPGSLSATDSRRVLEMSLPLQTNTLLFYGKAVSGGEIYDQTLGYSTNDCYGKLDAYQVGQTEGSAQFTLGKRLATAEKTKFETEEHLLEGILSAIMNSNLKGANHTAINAASYPTGLSGTDNPYGHSVTTAEYPELDWSSYNRTDGKSPVNTEVAATSLEQKMGNMYKQMTSIRADLGELRAASGEALIRTVTDLWTTVNEVRCTAPTSKAEAVAKFLADKISIRINQYFTASSLPTDGSPVSGVAFRPMTGNTGIRAAWVAEAAKPAEAGQTYNWPTDEQLADLGDISLATFPYRYNLPRGATHMAFDSEKKAFYYPTSFNTSGMGGAGAGDNFNAESYYYPAELLYFGNSPIRTSDENHRPAEYPTGASSWKNDASWSADWNGTHVKASTHSVAMKYDINYGTALLKTQVQYSVANLEDNNRYVQYTNQGNVVDAQHPIPNDFTELNKSIAVSGTSFLLTGVIIGGQYESVGWDFLPIQTGTPTPSYKQGFIYDKAVPSSARAIPAFGSGASSPNYTLVFDNFKAASQTAGIYTADTQDKVYVALEFLNNSGQDFYGNYNLIHDGGYFYLIGELDPANPSQGETTPHPNYVMPPYTAAGASLGTRRVFMQDYMTSVTFKLGQYSLQHAYLTVPDLRSGSMTLGLSVDINWTTGLVFEDVILGGNTGTANPAP